MAAKSPTLAEVRTMLKETFRKWGLDEPRLVINVQPRQVHRWAFDNDRKVSVVYKVRGRERTVSMMALMTPIENAVALAKAFEMARMAQVRDVAKILYGILQFDHAADAADAAADAYAADAADDAYAAADAYAAYAAAAAATQP